MKMVQGTAMDDNKIISGDNCFIVPKKIVNAIGWEGVEQVIQEAAKKRKEAKNNT